jgi:hypothetical protein
MWMDKVYAPDTLLSHVIDPLEPRIEYHVLKFNLLSLRGEYTPDECSERALTSLLGLHPWLYSYVFQHFGIFQRYIILQDLNWRI